MAGFLQSPGVQVTEKDVSLIVPGTSTSVGGVVGAFQWGPVMQPALISDENTLVSVFGKPNQDTYKGFFNAANFLAYTNALFVTRCETAGMKNSTSSGLGFKIINKDAYQEQYQDLSEAITTGSFTARYPGELGDSIRVVLVDSAAYDALIDERDNSPTPPSASRIAEINSIILELPSRPDTTDFAEGKGSSNDELHVIVYDAGGIFSGQPGTVLEKFTFLSKASDAASFEGTNNYYVNVIASRSQYIYVTGHPAGATNWGNTTLSTTSFASLTAEVDERLSGGVADSAAVDAQELIKAFDLYKDAEQYEISLLPVGQVPPTVFRYVIDNIAEVRKDLVVFGSVATPSGEPIFGSSSTRLADAKAYRDSSGVSNYAVIDSGFKYQYDKYNDVFRWNTINGDVAGLCARTDQTNDPWFSPGGLNRGVIKNAVKLAWNPVLAERDELYKAAINPVVAFAGQGILLFGDKTMTLKPSAFDRINVRRLFITLEKSISRAARFQLFEQNDAITRAQFVAQVEPFLRDVQGRRGIDAFRVVADETNNTPDVIARNEFRGTILIKPVYSINFIYLTFTAVGPNVSFDVAAGA